MNGFGEFFEGAMGMIFMGLFILIGIGDLYWLWMSFQLGSFMMFLLGMIPVFFVITGPVGAWSLLFGVPEWVVNIFG